MGGQLVECEAFRHREGGFAQAFSVFVIAGDLSSARGYREHTRRGGGDRGARELLRSSDSVARELTLTSVPRDQCQQRLQLGCPVRPADLEKRVAGRLQRLLSPAVVGLIEGTCTAEEQVGPFGVVLGPESERILVLRPRNREAV